MAIFKLSPEAGLSVQLLASYTRCREVLLKKLADVGLDPKCYSWHSFRSGGASSAANNRISDRMFKRQGRWRLENAKDGKVQDSLESRLRWL